METDIRNAHRERILLFIAAAFLGVGVLTLTLPDSSPAIGRWALVGCSFAASFTVAHVLLNRYLPDHDPFLLPAAALLTGWGLLLIGRLAINFLLRQCIWLLVSTAALLVVVRFSHDLRWLRRFRYTWLCGGLVLLAATLIFGANPSGYGPRLWLGAWGVYFQPAELLKLLMIVYLASYLAERGELIVSERWEVGRWRLPPLAYVGPLAAMFGLAVVLLAWQQDLGAAMLFFFTFLAMLYLATGQWEYVAAGLVLFVIAGLVGYKFSDRVALRVDGWLNPWPGAADRAFQIVQSLLAFGAGGILGRGLGLGAPTYIPAVHTDFVFAAIGEEFGLAGTLVVLAVYGVLLLRGFRSASRARRPFERFLAAGLTVGLVTQAWVIMAGNAKLAPIAGVTLPFVSYGGSSLLTSFIALGFLLRISAPAPESASSTTPHIQPLKPTPTRHSIIRLACVLSVALALLAATCGYWAVARADYLRARDDNPRRILYEQRIVRGRIVDRNRTVLASTEVTEDSTVRRLYPVPAAAPAVGYASLRYGTGGIEAALDAKLRGEAGRSSWEAAWDDLLHRPPHGRDVQLTLDAGLQIQAQQALTETGRAGAVVLLEVTGGEILVLASSPTFNPEHLSKDWESLRQDPLAPLLNRATQGLYQPGAALQTIVIAEALHEGQVTLVAPPFNVPATMRVNGVQIGCHVPPSQLSTLGEAYAAACPAPAANLGPRLGAAGLANAVERWALTTPPALGIPTAAADWSAETLTSTTALRYEAIGQGELTVSPLQMALVAGTLANEGRIPAPRLVLRVRDAQGNWREQPNAGEPRAILPPETARELLAAWQRHEGNVAAHWGVAVAGRDQSPHAWFLGVAPAQNPSYAIAVLVEQAADPHQAVEIGTALLQTATQ